jgi:inorganic pyrophosphatase
MVQMMVQVAAGSCDRHIYDERTLELLGKRSGSQPYPFPYGFIVGTSAEDGACVDCYLITRDPVEADTIVDCEPVGLLLQDEDGEMDHKVLAAMAGQEVLLGPELLQQLQGFIYAAFAAHPELRIRVGPILPRKAALEYLQRAGSR